MQSKANFKQARPHPRTLRSGFTLIELMVVVAIVGILSTLAVSGMSKDITQQRSYTALWQGMRNFCVTARAEAMRQGVQMAVAVSPTQLQLFRDDNHDCKVTAGEPVFATFPNAAANDPTPSASQTFSSGSLCATNAGISMFSFASTGEPALSDGGSWFAQQSFQITLTDTALNRTQTCTVWKTGYIDCGN